MTIAKDQIAISESTNKPLWLMVSASYIRSFRQGRHLETSELMPIDRRIMRACRKLYRDADQKEKAVLSGHDSWIERRERETVFTRLCYRLAWRAGLTAVMIDFPELEEETEENTNEPD